MAGTAKNPIAPMTARTTANRACFIGDPFSPSPLLLDRALALGRLLGLRLAIPASCDVRVLGVHEPPLLLRLVRHLHHVDPEQEDQPDPDRDGCDRDVLERERHPSSFVSPGHMIFVSSDVTVGRLRSLRRCSRKMPKRRLDVRSRMSQKMRSARTTSA